jgi:hypothetical protein
MNVMVITVWNEARGSLIRAAPTLQLGQHHFLPCCGYLNISGLCGQSLGDGLDWPLGALGCAWENRAEGSLSLGTRGVVRWRSKIGEVRYCNNVLWAQGCRRLSTFGYEQPCSSQFSRISSVGHLR